MVRTSQGLDNNNHIYTSITIKDYKYDDLHHNLRIIDYYGDGLKHASSSDYYTIDNTKRLSAKEKEFALKIYNQYEEELSKILNGLSKHSLNSLTESFRKNEHPISVIAYKIDKQVDMIKKNNKVFSWNHMWFLC